MSILTGQEITAEVRRGAIRIDPFNPRQVNPNSYNLRLGSHLLIYEKQYWLLQATENAVHHRDWPHLPASARGDAMDSARDEPVFPLSIPPEGRVLYPGILYLGHTVEYTETELYVPQVEGRSSVARLGWLVHYSAGWGDTAFRNDWTLEMSVIWPLRVYANTEVCQISYTTTKGRITPYRGKYNSSDGRGNGPRPSALWRELSGHAPPPG